MKQNEANARIIEQELENAAMGQPLNAAVIKSLAGLRTAFQKAVDSRLFQHNPFRKVGPGKQDREDKQQRIAFIIEEAKRLTEVLPGEWSDMVRVCLYTGGQRIGDIAKLKWEQIDLEG